MGFLQTTRYSYSRDIKKVWIKIFLFSLIIFTFFTFTTFADAQMIYTDYSQHYSFNLPKGWESIPPEIIDQYIGWVSEQANEKTIEYSAGFQIVQKDFFEYPYILVQEHDINTSAYSELENLFNGSDMQEIMEKEISAYSEVIEDVSFEEPLFDKTRHTIIIKSKMWVAEIGEIDTLSVLFLGKKEMVQINFYAVSSEYSKWLPVFTSVIDSFQYKSGYEYNPLEISLNEAGVIERTIGGAAGGALIGFIIALIICGIKKIIPKKEVSDKNSLE